MNICLKSLFFIIATLLLSSCTSSSEGDVLISAPMTKLCKEAKYGELNLNTVQNMEKYEIFPFSISLLEALVKTEHNVILKNERTIFINWSKLCPLQFL